MTISDTIYVLYIQFNINDLSCQIISFSNIAQNYLFLSDFLVQFYYRLGNVHKNIVYIWLFCICAICIIFEIVIVQFVYMLIF